MPVAQNLMRVTVPAASGGAAGTVTELWLYYWALGSPSVFRAYSYTVDGGAMSLVEEITAPSGGSGWSPDEWGTQGAFAAHSLGAGGEIAVWHGDTPNRHVWLPGSGVVYTENSSVATLARTPFVWVNGYWHYVFRSATLGWRLYRRTADFTAAEAVSDYEVSLAGTTLNSKCGSDGSKFYAWDNAANTAWAFAFASGVPAVSASQGEPLGVCDPADEGVMWDHYQDAVGGARQVGRIREPLTPGLIDRYPAEAPWRLFGVSHWIRHHYHSSGHVLAYGYHTFTGANFGCLLHNSVTAESGETPAVAVFSPPVDPAGSNRPWAAAIKTVAP